MPLYKLKTHEVYALLTLTMGFDHVAQYLASEALWVRALAHAFTASLFIFVGYNIGSRINKQLVIWSVLLTAADYVFLGVHGLWPLVAPVTIIFSRLVIEPMTSFALRSRVHFYGVTAVLLALALPSAEVMEYGTLALLLVFTGRLMRGGKEVPPEIVNVTYYYVFSYAVLLAWLIYNFGFDLRESLIMVIPACFYGYITHDIKAIVRNTLADKRKDWVRSACVFLGRNTLEIYSAELLLLKLLVVWAVTHPQ